MGKHIKVLGPVVVMAFLLSFVAAPRLVFAHQNSDTHESDTAASDMPASEEAKRLELQRKAFEQQRQQSLQKATELRQADLRKKSAAEQEQDKKKREAFAKGCEQRHENFGNRLGTIRSTVSKHVTTLDSIVTRVDAFKTSKNLTVSNYDALLADAKTKGQIVHDLQAVLKEKAAAFTCGSGPEEAKASLEAYKDAFQQEIDAFKAYKTSVKNLIAAVKTAAQAARTGEDHAQN